MYLYLHKVAWNFFTQFYQKKLGCKILRLKNTPKAVIALIAPCFEYLAGAKFLRFIRLVMIAEVTIKWIIATFCVTKRDFSGTRKSVGITTCVYVLDHLLDVSLIVWVASSTSYTIKHKVFTLIQQC